MKRTLESLPRRIFLDSCTAQTLRDYGGFIYDGEQIAEADRIHRIPDGPANLDALRNVFMVSERASFEWIVSKRSLDEARDKRDRGHMQWLWDIADHSTFCLNGEGPTPQSEKLADRLTEPKFGYLGAKDRLLLQDAVFLRCEAFLTMERRLPRNAAHIGRELGCALALARAYR
jgi:hypothetical protein